MVILNEYASLVVGPKENGTLRLKTDVAAGLRNIVPVKGCGRDEHVIPLRKDLADDLLVIGAGEDVTVDIRLVGRRDAGRSHDSRGSSRAGRARGPGRA